MSGTIVTAYLFRVTEALTLTHPSKVTARQEPLETMSPAVLVIPRSGGLRDPYVVVQARARVGLDAFSSASASVDVHVRARIDGANEHAWKEVADVLVHPRGWLCGLSSGRTAQVFGRFPGCEVLVSRYRKGCLLAMRDGRTVAVTGSAIFPAVGATAWPAVYGSVLHCWLTAGVPLSSVEDATVIAGHCDAATGGVRRLAVAARTHLYVARPERRRRSVEHPTSGRWKAS